MSRTRFIFFGALLFFCIESPAQILIGPSIGTHVGWVSYEDDGVKDLTNVEPNIGLNVGASVSFRVRKRFFLQTSLLYSRKSKIIKERKVEGQSADLDFSNDSKYNYLEMPILYMIEFKGKLSKKSNKEFKWYLGAGPTVSYWLGGKGVLTDGDLIENYPLKNPLSYKITFGKDREDVKQGEMNVDDANRVQLALNISTGIILEPVGFNKIMISLRYEFGHSFLSRTSDGYFGGFDGGLFYEDELQARIQTLNLSLNYFIDLKTDQRNKGKSTIKTKRGKLR